MLVNKVSMETHVTRSDHLRLISLKVIFLLALIVIGVLYDYGIRESLLNLIHLENDRFKNSLIFLKSFLKKVVINLQKDIEK